MHQARIRKLRKQLLPEPDEGYQDDDAHRLPYFIGKSQNSPISVPSFLRAGRDDPAMKVRLFSKDIHALHADRIETQDFTPKLKRHLLPRIYAQLLSEAKASKIEDQDTPHIALLTSLVNSSIDNPDFSESPDAESDANSVYFHSDRFYAHKVLHINYTSYDVRRETDVVNPKTSRRNIMCLRSVEADTPGDSSAQGQGGEHRFIHAQVLGIFHANIVYRGRGSSDLRKRRFDFLFVRWFTFVDPDPVHRRLDRVTLSPLKDVDAVGFLDPADVLRASHIVPRYSLGPMYPESQGTHRLYPNKCGSDPVVSKQARDWEDWHEYFVNR